jgi:hypothetical protein
LPIAVHPEPPEDRLGHGRAVVDEQRAVELAAPGARVGRRAQLRQRSLRGRQAGAPRGLVAEHDDVTIPDADEQRARTLIAQMA